MSAIKDMGKWLARLKPKPEERRILRRVIAYCRALNITDEHIKSIMKKSGLTQ